MAGTHSRELAGVFKRCMINFHLLKVKEVCLEVGTVVNAYNCIFRGFVREIMFLAIATFSVLDTCILFPIFLQ